MAYHQTPESAKQLMILGLLAQTVIRDVREQPVHAGERKMIDVITKRH